MPAYNGDVNTMGWVRSGGVWDGIGWELGSEVSKPGGIL